MSNEFEFIPPGQFVESEVIPAKRKKTVTKGENDANPRNKQYQPGTRVDVRIRLPVEIDWYLGQTALTMLKPGTRQIFRYKSSLAGFILKTFVDYRPWTLSNPNNWAPLGLGAAVWFNVGSTVKTIDGKAFKKDDGMVGATTQTTFRLDVGLFNEINRIIPNAGVLGKKHSRKHANGELYRAGSFNTFFISALDWFFRYVKPPTDAMQKSLTGVILKPEKPKLLPPPEPMEISQIALENSIDWDK